MRHSQAIRKGQESVGQYTSFLLVVTLLAGAAACNRKHEVPDSGANGSAAANPEPPNPFPQHVPDVLARVNGEEVTRIDFDLLVRNFELGQGPITSDRRDEVFRNLLDELITHKVLHQEAAARKFVATDAEVEDRMKLLRADFPTPEAFEKALGQRNMSEERLRADMRAEIEVQKFIDSETKALLDVTDEDARDFYDKNTEKFKQGEAIRASHILLKVDEKASEAVRKQKLGEIQRILERARAGEDFAALAKAHSEDGSAANGGDLEFFERGRMVPEFEQAAFALKPGQLSDVVATKYGYHIIKVTDWRPPSIMPLESVNLQLKNHLMMQRFRGRVEALIAELKKKSRIEVLV